VVAGLQGGDPEQVVGAAPYALLRCLLDQLADVLAELPDDHQATLLAAAGRDAEAPAFEIRLGTATVNLVRTASTALPLLKIADDAQLLNAGAAQRLAYIARRLAAPGCCWRPRGRVRTSTPTRPTSFSTYPGRPGRW